MIYIQSALTCLIREKWSYLLVSFLLCKGTETGTVIYKQSVDPQTQWDLGTESRSYCELTLTSLRRALHP